MSTIIRFRRGQCDINSIGGVPFQCGRRPLHRQPIVTVEGHGFAGQYGHRYRIVYEEQWREWAPEDQPWLARIACRYGHVGVQGGGRLHAFTDRPVIGARLRRLAFVERAQGDADVRVVFHVDHLAEVLAILRPYRRRQGLSEAQRAALAAGRRHFARRLDVENSAGTVLESTPGRRTGSNG